MPPVPVGQLAPVQNPGTQGSAVPAWLAATNTTSALALAWSGNVNHTNVPGLGPVVLPSPLASVEGNLPASLMSPWYDYMTQPAIPDYVNYTTTMQGPGYFWGVLFDRGYNDQIGSNDVVQGYIGDCAIGAAVIALAESGFFNGRQPLSIAAGAPKPYFDVRFLSPTGVAATQKIDDMLPFGPTVNTTDGFLGYQPAINGLNTPASPNNANTVLSVPYIEKAFAKYLDHHGDLKLNSTLMGYAGLSGISAATVLNAFRGTQAQTIYRLNNPGWNNAVGDCMQNAGVPCVFGTPDSLTDLPSMGDRYNAATQTVSWNDGAAMQWTTLHNNDLLIYTAPGQQPVVFVAAHAYGMMRSGYTTSTQASLGNPWHINPDVNGVVGGSRMITMPQLVLERATVELFR